MNELKPESIKYLIIHCSATPPSMDIGVDEIDKWHRDRNWSKIGYHIIIRRNPGKCGGLVEYGTRTFIEVGAHARNYNSISLGICLVGGIDEFNNPENNFTLNQFRALTKTINFLMENFPNAEVIGHRDLPGVNKECPCFNVKDWFKTKNSTVINYI